MTKLVKDPMENNREMEKHRDERKTSIIIQKDYKNRKVPDYVGRPLLVGFHSSEVMTRYCANMYYRFTLAQWHVIRELMI